MSKHLYPDAPLFVFKKSFLLAAMLLVFGFNRSFAQCDIAAESNAQLITPSGCNNGSFDLGAGAYIYLTVNANTYYNWSFSAGSGCVNGFCAVPQNGNATSFSSNVNDWFSGTTTTLLVSTDRNGCFNSTSAVMTYRYSTPSISAVAASPNPICVGSTLNLTSTSADAATLTWAGSGFTGSGNNTTLTNIQTSNAGIFTFTADNSGCSVSLSTAAVVVHAPATGSAGANQTMCSSAGSVGITGASASNDAGVSWATSGSGTFTNGATLTPTYTPSGADIAAGSVTLTLTVDGNAPCGNITSSKTLTIVSSPSITTMGGNQTACSNAGAVPITGVSATNTSAGISWGTSGTGVFSNGTTLAPSYTPSPADLTAGSVTLTLTVSATAPCSAVSASKTLTFTTAPTVSAGGAQSTCSNAGAVSLTGASASNDAGLTWSTSGNGTFSNTGILNPTYTPGSTDLTNGSVTLTLTANGNSPCASASSSKVLTITPAAVVSAGGNQTTCSDAGNVSITGASASNDAALSWTTSGTGIFTNGNTLNPSYTLSSGDVSAGSITLTLTATGNSPCANASSSKTLTIIPAPVPNAGGNQTTCSNAGTVSITGASASNATLVKWTTLGGSGTFTADSTLTPTYTPSPADIASGSVILELTAYGTAPCNPSVTTKVLTIIQAPTANAGPALSTCANSGTVSISGASAANYSSLSWSTSGTGTFTNSSTLITGYTPSAADTVAGSVTLTLTATGNGPCASATSTLVLTINPLPTGSISGSTSICTGSSATLTFNVGNATPFDIIYTDGTNNYTANGISTGYTATYSPTAASTTYQYTSITDNNGCTRTSNFLGGATIMVTPLPVISSVVADPALCFGTSTGSISITATSGSPGYTYSIDSGVTFQSSNVFSGLPAGNDYVLEVSDTHGCASFYSGNDVTITQPTVLTQTDSSVTASCANVFDGSITAYASGGTPPYKYALNGGPSQSSSTFGNLGAGTYIVDVTDFNGCLDTAHVTITNSYIVSDSLLSQTNVSCFGGNDGAMTVQITGGVPPYSYSDNGSTFQSSPTFTGLTAGNYVVTLRDSRGCTDFLQVTITQPALLDIVIDSLQNIACSGTSGGAIYLTINGGTSPYTFTWSNGATTQNVTGLSAGTYNVTVLDHNGCNASSGATLTQPLPLFLNIATVHNLSCYNDSSGFIYVGANGGVPPYNYTWSNGATTQDISGLSIGTYVLTVVDANSCQATISQAVNQPTQLTSGIVPANVTCNGAANGSVALTVTGGTQPYAFLWSNGATTQNLSNVSGGTYSVQITDANGCSISNVTTVVEPAAIVLTISSTDVSCNGGSNGTVNTTVTGGTGTITYAWSNGATTANLTGVGAGPYSVIITDANSCTASASVTITQPTALVLNGTVANVSCSGGSNGSVSITVNGGVFPYSYAWSNGATTQDINGVAANSYTVTATDANLCTVTAIFNVTSPTPITSSIVGTNVTCHGEGNGTATLTVNGGTSPYTFSWSNFEATQNLTGLSGGTYYVIITDANGCTHRDSVIITEPAAIVLGISSTNVSCNGGTNGTVTTTVTGGTGTITYAWSNGATTANLTGVGAGTYTVVITDANSCTATDSTTITQPTALLLNGTVANVSCAGGDNGSIAITIYGGVVPYTFAWSNGATTQNVNALTGGQYSVVVTDANSCTISASFNVNNPTPISSSVVGTNVTCHGEGNGTATLTVTGGTSPYTFFWSNFSATQNITGLSGGTYYVIITDANGCTGRDSVTITEPAAILLSLTSTDVSCNSGNNGTVTSTVTGGTGTITYTWSNGATTANLTGVTAGTYSLVVTDANSCTASASVTISQPTALVLNGTAANVGCFGGNDGSIQITVNGGVPPYSYSWSNGATTQNVNGLTGGVTYIVTATDANSCTVTASFTITSPAALVTSVTGIDVTCHGAANGSATVTVSGGTSPYSYLWSNFQGSATINNLSGGLYYVIVTDGNGCTKKDSIVINEPTQIIITSTVTQITCSNANNGTINLTVTGGVPGYTYVWSPTLPGNPSQTGLGGGNYSVTVTDTHSCSVATEIDMINPPAIAVNSVVSNPRCFGDSNGVINLIVSGGEPAYTYQWNIAGDTMPQINNASVGVYYVTVTDSRGCSKTDSAIVLTPSQLYTSGVIKNVSCAGNRDGDILVTVYGGTLPYSFEWSNLSSAQNQYQLSGGNYYVTVTDANGCQVASLYIVHEPIALTLNIAGTNVSCFGGHNGTLTALPGGGTTPYRYVWSDVSSDSLQTGVPAGLYGLQLIDSNGCYAFDSIILTQPTPINITGFSNNAICFNTATGSVVTVVTGGTPGYQYIWSNGGIDSAINTVSAGLYVVTVTDAASCSATADFTVNQGSKITIDLATYDPICYAGNTGGITALVTGGVQPYHYVWSNGVNDTAVAIDHLVAGTYAVTVTDNVGCSITSNGTLNQPAIIAVSPGITGARCSNSATGTVIINTTGGTAPFNYSLNGVGQSSDTFTHVLPGSYDVIATDVNGCQGTDTFSISTPNNISVSLTVTDPIIVTGMSTQLSATATSNTPIIHYIWSPIAVDSMDVFDYSCPDTTNCPAPYVKPPFTTVFMVTAVNADSCEASDTVTVYVHGETGLEFLPTAFTPNGDGLNDRFTFAILGANTIEVSIYDRWGERVYYDAAQPNGISNSYGWDGTKNGKNAPTDTYVYQLVVTYFDNTTKTKSGTVTLIR